ncbi:hypothetical protein ZTR_09027 [Talaromyces verruculosus]|nr:hypothetical protein ZTR_09027 [Talaromyces verruculosus]
MKTSAALGMEEEQRRLMEENHEPLQPQEIIQSAGSPYRSIYVISSISLVLALVTLISLMPLGPSSDSSCRNPTIRREWRGLSLNARQKYVAAAQCLTRGQSRLGLSTTRYDDFVYAHLAVANDTHGTPISMPWHRVYVQRYADALRDECDYDEALPYWDWAIDASKPASSPVWSNDDYGMGGNGSAPDNCLLDGPFRDMKPQYPEPHCLKRNFAAENMYGIEYTPSIVGDLLAKAATYHDFRLQLESGPHRFIHLGIGGEMPELWSSNGTVLVLGTIYSHADIRNLSKIPYSSCTMHRSIGFGGCGNVEAGMDTLEDTMISTEIMGATTRVL